MNTFDKIYIVYFSKNKYISLNQYLGIHSKLSSLPTTNHDPIKVVFWYVYICRGESVTKTRT